MLQSFRMGTASRLVEMITEVAPQQCFRNAFEVGCGTGASDKKAAQSSQSRPDLSTTSSVNAEPASAELRATIPVVVLSS